MQTSNNERALVPSVFVEIAPAYSKALAQTANHYKVMVAFVKAQMQQGIDYGVIPGTRKPNGHLTLARQPRQPCPPLLKPGAEKLCRLFNLRPSYELIQSVADFDKPLFHYHYRCVLYRQGEMVGQGDGCCNSMEIKYQKQKHRVFDLTNTICCLGARSYGEETSPGSHRKIAQKRALVAAENSSCGASEFFTQDLEEL